MRRILGSDVLVAGATVVALLATTAGGAFAARTQQPTRAGGTLIYPYIGANLWVKALDPALLQDTQSLQILNLVYSGMYKLDGQNHTVPDLAAGMPTISADKKTYTIKIRQDAKFSDGTPVTAMDVVYSWTRALTKKEGSAVALSYMGQIKGANELNSGKATTLSGVKAIDPRTVQLTLVAPGTYFLAELVYSTYYVVKQNVAAGQNLVGAGSQALSVGTGPFMFSKPWRYRQEMYLAPNPNWYDAKRIQLAEIDVPFLSDNDAIHREYLAGQVPMSVVPAQFLPSEQHLPDYHVIPQLAIDYISPNGGPTALCKPISCAPTNNLHYRKAMLYAIDRTTINAKILHGGQANLCGIVPQGIDGYSADLCKLTPYDPARAKAEFALAKKDFGGTIPNDGKLTLTYQTSGQAIVNEYTEIQSEWAAVGINVTLKGQPFNDWVNTVTVKTTTLAENAWADDYPDAQDFTHNLLSVSGAYDITNFNNPQFEKLIAQADVTPNGPARAALYIAAQKIAIDNVAFIGIGQVNLPWRWKTNLHGLALSSGFNYPIAANDDWTQVSVS